MMYVKRSAMVRYFFHIYVRSFAADVEERNWVWLILIRILEARVIR